MVAQIMGHGKRAYGLRAARDDGPQRALDRAGESWSSDASSPPVWRRLLRVLLQYTGVEQFQRSAAESAARGHRLQRLQRTPAGSGITLPRRGSRVRAPSSAPR